MGYGHGSDHDCGHDGGYGHEGYSGSGTSEPFRETARRFVSEPSNVLGAFFALAIGGFLVTGIAVVLYGLLFTN